jgi:septum formation protein
MGGTEVRAVHNRTVSHPTSGRVRSHPTAPDRSREPIVLASASPRRQALLRSAGVAFEVRPADLDETPRPGEAAAETLVRLARAKALDVAEAIGEPRRLVVGADTGVLIDGLLLGKPRDPAHATWLLAQLVGRTHLVITAVAVAEPVAGRVWQCSVTSRVTMREATREEIARYVATGEPLDKAGAYAFQGEGRRFVAKVEGSESNVIGLPMEETLALLACARGG